MKRLRAVTWPVAAVLLFAVILGGRGLLLAHDANIRVVAVLQTSIEEPWNGVIHQALLRAHKELSIHYEWIEKLSGAAFERALREHAEKNVNLITGDSFRQEQAARRVAKSL